MCPSNFCIHIFFLVDIFIYVAFVLCELNDFVLWNKRKKIF